MLRVKDINMKVFWKLYPNRFIRTYYNKLLGFYRYSLNYKNFLLKQDLPEFKQFLTFLKEHEVTTMLEIGSYRGASLYAYLQTLQTLQTLVSVDIKRPYRINHVKLYAEKQGIEFHFIKGNSFHDSIKKQLQAFQFDCVFIDGNHQMNALFNDFQIALDLEIKYICFHDISIDYSSECDVYSFWSQLRHSNQNKYQFYEFQSRYGIGVMIND